LKDVVLTHLHYDHCGNLGRFPAARFHLQESEIHYATGRYMAYPKLSHSFEVEDVCDVVRLNYRRRIKFYNGDAELAPGIELYAAGGHSAGLQFARGNTARGWVVVASDVSHFYENMEPGPSPLPSMWARCWRVSSGSSRSLRRARISCLATTPR
jgi:glyoxylase-like metal-dependent hydrolase (beta-lactamase superfamily II)